MTSKKAHPAEFYGDAGDPRHTSHAEQATGNVLGRFGPGNASVRKFRPHAQLAADRWHAHR